jgi:hypothetical protein
MASVNVNSSRVVLTLSHEEAGYVLDLLAAANEPLAEELFDVMCNSRDSSEDFAAA